MNDFIIKNSNIKGQGLFVSRDFGKNDILMRFDGVKILRENIEDFSSPITTCYLQIGTNLYLNIENTNAYFINHSCNPNCYIKIIANTAFLLASIPIANGAELTYDYSLTSTENTDTWSMNCNCSKFGCRKIITGFNSINDTKQKEYIDAGRIPKYVYLK